MRCEVTYEELAAFSAGDTESGRGREIERHLESCDLCRRRLKAIGAADSRLHALPRLEPPSGALLRTRRALSREVRGVTPEIMTLDEVAEFLRVSVGDLEEVVTDLPAFEIGGQVRVRRSKLVQWVEERERTYARQRAETEVHGILAGLM